MTVSDVDSISIERAFWVQIVEGRFSFTMEDVPTGIHFTFSSHPQSSKHNFHVSRNTGDGKSKPKYVVCEMDKQTLGAEKATQIVKTIMDSLFEPFAPIKWESRKRKKHVLFAFHPTDEGEEQVSKDFVDCLQPYYRIVKRKLKLHSISQLPTNVKTIDRLREVLPISAHRFCGTMPQSCVIGLLKTPVDEVLVIRFEQRWLRLKKNVGLRDVLVALAGEQLAAALSFKLKKGIVIVSKANSYEEVAHLHSPVFLTIR